MTRPNALRSMALILSGMLAAPANADTGRRSIDLDPGWKFIRQDVTEAAKPTFDDSTWDTVSIPHTWNAKDGEDGPPPYYRGPGWYRRHLAGPAVGLPTTGGQLILRFDAASAVADVYVNGKPAGEHKGMFAAFCFDVTNLIDRTGDNVIAVRVDNAARKDVPPLSADFTFFGGIYRDVSLTVLNDVSIDALDDAGPGVYLKQANVSESSADLAVTTKLRNVGDAGVESDLKIEVLDAGGAVIKTATPHVTIAGKGSASTTVPIAIDRPHLWMGRKDPYLYQVRVTATVGGHDVDSVTQPLGLRTFKVDPNKGFFLNGQSYPLHGVNRHQDRLDQGWAISNAEQAEDFNLIMEMGCTGIRLAHYQHAQVFYDLCDKGGLAVWAEACLVNKVTDSPEFDAAALQQVRELVKQNYNHPSIFFWSLYNELGGKPGDGQSEHQVVLVRKLNELAKSLDPDRLTTGASIHQTRHPLNDTTDVLAFNHYPGWYSGKLTDFGKLLDKNHADYPEKSAAISEYGAGGSIYQHEAVVVQPKPFGPWHPEEWETEVHEHAWAAIETRPYLWGSFLWNMFDFAIDSRHEGDTPGRNDKGLVTYDRKTKKDAFYFYKANWSSEPFVYITDRRFTPRKEDNVPVKIFSNLDSVQLVLNGTPVGTIDGHGVHDHIFLFDQTKMKVGDNTLHAIGTAGGKTFSDDCVITVDPTMTERK